MKILIYNPYWSSLGGGEKYITVLGEVLSQQGNNVVFLSSDESISKEKLEKYFNADLSHVQFDYVKNFSALTSYTKDFDIMFSVTNFRAVPSAATKNVYIMQAPYGTRTYINILRNIVFGKIKESAKDFFRMRLLERSKHIAGVVVYSQFVQRTLLHHHNVRSHVLTPPIDDFFMEGIKKEKIILSVGRIFAGFYNQKRYDITTKAFREIAKDSLAGWEFHIVGSVAKDDASQKMLEHLLKINEGFPVYFHLNEPYDKLKEWYNRASIFWHAAGYGVDEEKYPEQTEHFGMSTVEAMSAYAVPVVVNNGGQKEIVQSGINGFLWNTTEELKEFTIHLAQNDDVRNLIAQNCRSRYFLFDRKRFVHDTLRMMESVVASQ
ncbi:MAG: glycosyltransferase family 4 protein [Bacteroidota bacterium]